MVELVSVGPQSDFQQAMLASSTRNAAYSRLQRLGRVLSVLLDNRGPSWTRPQCPAQGLPACLHNNVLEIVRLHMASRTKGEALQRYFKSRRKRSRVAGQEELWLWVRSGLILAPPVIALGTQSSLCLVSLSLWEILVVSKQRSRRHWV